MEINEVKKINQNDTLNKLNTLKNINIIVNDDLNNNLYIRSNNNFNILLFIRNTRKIILSLIITSIIVTALITIILYVSETKKKSIISFNHNLNLDNNDNIDGYYIPKDRLLNPSYKKCSIDNCKKCYGNSSKDTCISCFNSYDPIRDKNNIIISCVYNPKNEEVNNNTLQESDTIDFSELNNESKNETTSIEAKTELNTINITENISTIISQKITNYFPENKTVIIQSTFIERTPKSTSIVQIPTTEIVIKCNSGYYYPEQGENKCKKCSEKGCKICHGNATINFCDSCFSQYIPRYIDNNLTCFEPDEKNCIEFNNTSFQCLKCSDEYIIFENKCISYSIEASYYTDEDNLNVKLINLNILYIDKIIFDGEILSSYNNTFFYNRFPNIGIHKVYYFFKNNLTSFSN